MPDRVIVGEWVYIDCPKCGGEGTIEVGQPAVRKKCPANCMAGTVKIRKGDIPTYKEDYDD